MRSALLVCGRCIAVTSRGRPRTAAKNLASRLISGALVACYRFNFDRALFGVGLPGVLGGHGASRSPSCPRLRARLIAVSVVFRSVSSSAALAPCAICLVAGLSLNRLEEPRMTILPFAVVVQGLDWAGGHHAHAALMQDALHSCAARAETRAP